MKSKSFMNKDNQKEYILEQVNNFIYPGCNVYLIKTMTLTTSLQNLKTHVKELYT